MYAHALRKWSLAKYQMYLWLPVLMLLVCRSPGASSMHLAPLRSIPASTITPSATHGVNTAQPTSPHYYYPQQPVQTSSTDYIAASITTESLNGQQQQREAINTDTDASIIIKQQQQQHQQHQQQHPADRGIIIPQFDYPSSKHLNIDSNKRNRDHPYQNINVQNVPNSNDNSHLIKSSGYVNSANNFKNINIKNNNKNTPNFHNNCNNNVLNCTNLISNNNNNNNNNKSNISTSASSNRAVPQQYEVELKTSGQYERSNDTFKTTRVVVNDRNLTNEHDNLQPSHLEATSSSGSSATSDIPLADPTAELHRRIWLQQTREKRARIEEYHQRLQAAAAVASGSDQVAASAAIPPSVHMQLLQLQQLSDADELQRRKRRDSRPFALHAQPRARQRRYCSARDPSALAFEAPTVFEGRIRSMSSDRRINFSVTFEVIETYKKQEGFKLPAMLRLQFIRNATECDIYREVMRPRGYVREELEQGKIYFLFVEQIDLGNFTILGQPIKKTKRAANEVRLGVSDDYGQHASIESLQIANNATAREGRRVRIVCKVRGQPPPKVTWFKNGRSFGRNKKKYQFIHLRKRSELIIKEANKNDSGLYECRAKNKLARQPVTQSLRIEVFPKDYESTTPPDNWRLSGSPCPVIGNAFCLNGGTCVFFKDVGEPACKCPDGYMGNRCETKTTNSQPRTYNKEQQQCGDKFFGSYYC